LKWKIYFWVIVFYQIGIVSYLSYSDPKSLIIGIGSIFDIIFVIGLFGYSYRKPILKKSLWMIVFIASILVYVNGLIVSPYNFYVAFGTIEFETIATLWIPFLPLLAIPYALFQYSKNSDEVWQCN